MDAILIAGVGFLLLINLAAVAFFILRPKQNEAGNGMSLIQQQLLELQKTVDEKLAQGSDRMFESIKTQADQSQKLVSSITDRVSAQLLEVARGVAETNASTKQVFTIAEQLNNLEKVLKNQKQRGNLGEMALELVLSNILPPSVYKLQYQFPGGDIVDAIVMTKEGFIPVDAKFSLDNYTRTTMEDDPARREVLEKDFKNDLKKRIDETSKYIRPQDGTLPFAFMFIPAEGIYYDLLINEVGAVKVNTRNLIDYAYKDKNVIIVSPTTFAAYLQSVLYGFRAFKIEESAKQIGKQVEDLSRHLNAYDEYFRKIGSSLSTTVNHYNTSRKELGKIDKDVLRISGRSPSIEIGLIQGPEKDE